MQAAHGRYVQGLRVIAGRCLRLLVDVLIPYMLVKLSRKNCLT